MGKVNAGSSGYTGQVNVHFSLATHMLCLYTQRSFLTTFTTNKTYDLVSNNMKSTKKREKTSKHRMSYKATYWTEYVIRNSKNALGTGIRGL